MATDNNDFTHEFQIYSTDLNAGTMGTGKFLLFDNNINALKVEGIDNIKIGGGTNGRVLATDGEGNLRWISAAAVTGGISSYNELDDLPTLFSGSYNDLTNKPTLFSGSYVDLTNKPTIPADVSDLTDTTNLLGGINYDADGELSLPTNGYTEAVIKELDATALVLFAQSVGGNIKLLAGSTSAAGAKQWLFNGTTGNLTLPAGGDIKDSTGASVLGGASGSYFDTVMVGGSQAAIADGTTQFELVAGTGIAITSGSNNQITISSTASESSLSAPYKGFRAHYGRMYNNTDDENGPINKIVIYKDTVSPSSAIDASTNSDDFQVTGLTGSDVVAMLVVISDGTDWATPTPTSTLKTFAEDIIDYVILNNGVPGNVRSISQMKDAFYNSFNDFKNTISNVKTNLDFFDSLNNPQYNITNVTYNGTTGAGANFSAIQYNFTNSTFELGSWGQNAPGGYVVGDTFTILGTDITDANTGAPFASPANDTTITVNSVDGSGFINNVSITSGIPVPTQPDPIWPDYSINDGGDDEYDGANAIHTNLATNIPYNSGNVVSSSSAFNGGDYVVTYENGIFGLFATNANIDIIGTSGNSGGYGNDSSSSGFDGDGVADTGGLYGEVVEVPPATIIANTDGTSTYSVSVGTDGVVTMTTSRGGIEFGALPEPGGPNHLHIMRPAGQNGATDLYFGDDYNYVKMPGLYGSNPNHQQGVEIGSSLNEGTVHKWKFGTDGNLTLPGNLVIAGNTSVFGTNSSLLQTTDDLPLIAISSGANGAVSSIWIEDIGNVGTSNIAAVYANPIPGSGIVRIAVGSNSSNVYLWDFGTDGKLALPATGVIVESTTQNVLNLNRAGEIHLSTYGPNSIQLSTDWDGTGGSWFFGADGNLTLPAGGDILDSTGASVLGGGSTLPANASGYLVNDGAGALSWAAGDGTFSGDYNDLTNKPTYRIAVATGAGPGGNLQADSLALAGLNPVTDIPSTWGGDLILQGGVGGANGDLYGEVRIKSGQIGANYEWHFTTDKKIKLPAGGDIVNSTGATAFVSLATLKQVVADSTDFADFQTRIANM